MAPCLTQVIQYLRTTSENFSRRNPGYGFRGDPLNPTDPGKYYGYLVWAGDIIQGRSSWRRRMQAKSYMDTAQIQTPVAPGRGALLDTRFLLVW